MATDIDALMGVDSLTSLDQDTNVLSARSNSSQSSLDDVLGGHRTRKKKSSTLNRLRKLKKPADLNQHIDGLSSTPPVSEIPKDLSEERPAERINSKLHVGEELDRGVKTTDQRLQDGQQEISSLLSRERNSLNKKPSPSPRIKPRRFHPQDGTLGALDGGGAHRVKSSEFEIHHSPFGSLSQVSSLDGATDRKDSYKNGSTDTSKKDTYNSGSAFGTGTFPSPKMNPRRFVNHDESMMGYNATEMRISKERTEKSFATSEGSERKSKENEFNHRNLDSVLSSTNRVSTLTSLQMAHPEIRNNHTSVVEKSTEYDGVRKEMTVIPSEIVSEKTEMLLSSKMSEDILEEDADNDSEDLLVIPDNSHEKTVTKLNPTSNVTTEAVRRLSADGQSDSVEISSSLSSLTDVSKLMSPVSTSTPTKTNTNSETDINQNQPTSDDDDDLIVSTFADKDIEDVIRPTSLPTEESNMKRLSSEEFAAELNQLSEDESLQRYNQSLKESISSSTVREDGEVNDERTLEASKLESVDQTLESANDRPAPLIVEPPPSSAEFPLKSKTSYRDDADNSFAMSEPTLGSNSFCSDTNRSFMSTGALSTITTRSARHKSYLSGGASTSGSLLSKEELERFFPDRKVKIFVTTWNMCEGKVLPDNLEELLLPEDCVLVQDIYVIGTQESGSDGQEWEVRLQETLGPSHVLLQSATYGVLRLLIFIRRDLIWFCSAVEEDTVSTRAFSMIKTKGAVGLSFTFFGTSFLFINSHFAAGDEQNKERIADYNKIIKELQLPIKVPPTRKYNNLNTDVTTRFDCIFWCGDFNFRLVGNRTKVENWAGKLRDGKEDDYNILLQHDQLKKAWEKKLVFRGFQEGEIQFLPTYKYDIGGDVYDTSVKARVPSYTDRVFCKSRRPDQIYNVLYNACNSIKTSDHKPVYAMYEVKIRPGKDDSLTAGGVYSRDVFIEANRRRAAKSAMSGAMMSQKSSTVCSVM